jgi:hypothetical protein
MLLLGSKLVIFDAFIGAHVIGSQTGVVPDKLFNVQVNSPLPTKR